MPTTRRIAGEILFPADTPAAVASRVLVEVRDVSVQDEASVVIASKVMHNVSLAPNARVPFELASASVPAGRSLSLRVQVDMHELRDDSASGRSHASGDFLTTTDNPVPASGDALALTVRVAKIQ
jgi:hypothetical protein